MRTLQPAHFDGKCLIPDGEMWDYIFEDFDSVISTNDSFRCRAIIGNDIWEGFICGNNVYITPEGSSTVEQLNKVIQRLQFKFSYDDTEEPNQLECEISATHSPFMIVASIFRP